MLNLDSEWKLKQELDKLTDAELTLLVVVTWDVLVTVRNPFSNWLLQHLDVTRQVSIHAELVRNTGSRQSQIFI